jgi:hypothetical protein
VTDPEFKECLLRFSDQSLDDKIKPKIRAWSDPPTALQILEVLDACIYGSLCTGVIVMGLQQHLNQHIAREGTTLEAVVAQAAWRRASL